MLTKRYLSSTKNLGPLLERIVDGVAPDKFTVEYLQSMGFTSSNDRAFIPLLKELGFLSPDSTPTARYLTYRDRSRSKTVMAAALREAYGDVFHIREYPTTNDRSAVEGLFRSKLNSTDRVAKLQTMTFYALLDHADLQATDPGPAANVDLVTPARDADEAMPQDVEVPHKAATLTTQLHYTIQVHLPATKDIEVFNAIFRSLRENLLS